MEFSPIKSASSKRVAANIIERIRSEDPSFWPYGVSVGHHDGGLFLVREASTHEPVGFTGWQQRNDGMKKVAYYSIGILPEHRSKGYAKEAVAKLREKLAGEVDEFRAFIMPHNKASIGLADALNIPIEFDSPGEKMAHVKEANPLKWLLSPAGKSITGAMAGGGAGAAMYGKADQWRDNPWAAATGIGANALLGSHLARLPAGSKLGFNDLMRAMAMGVGANTAPHVYKATKQVGEATDSISDVVGEFQGTVDAATQDLRDNEILNKINWAVREHPNKVAWGALGLGAAVPLAMAISNYTHRARTKAITNLSQDLERLQQNAKEEMSQFIDRDNETDELEKEAMAKLPGILGTILGGGGGLGLNQLIYPEEAKTPNSFLGEAANLIAGLYAGNRVGSSFNKGISNRLKNKMRMQATTAGAGGPFLGSMGVMLRDSMDEGMGIFTEKMPELATTLGNMTSPFSGVASFKDYWEKNKGWLMPTAVLSHTIPLAVWAHSSYAKDKGISDMTEHFIKNQDRYLKAHDPSQREAEEITDEVVKEAGIGKALKWLAPRALGGGANTALWDQYVYGDRDIKDWDSGRTLGALIAMLTGGSAGGSIAKGMGASKQMAGGGLSKQKMTALEKVRDKAFGGASLKFLATPAERFIMTGAASNEATRALADAQKGQIGKTPPSPPMSTSVGDLIKDNPGKTALIAALSAGGLGYLGHRMVKALEKPQEIQIDQKPSTGHLKITLPTKDPNDNETQVVLPLDAASTVNLSKSLQDTIGRDARRKLRTGAKERVRRRKPTKKEEEDNVIHFDKSAAPTIDVVVEILEKLPA